MPAGDKDLEAAASTNKAFTLDGGAIVKAEDIPIQSSTKDGKPSEVDETERGNWGNKVDFMLSCIGFAVGLGNVWRFPYLCYINGGGAFLVPYVIMLMIAGLPMFVMELGFGQFASKGCITIWTISPVFKGLGYAMCIITALVAIYYNVVICYTLFFLFASFTSVLPWSDCNREWNTANCVVSKVNGTNGTTVYLNTSTRPSLEFWDRYVLDRSDGMEDMGPIRWQIALCLLLAWTVVFLCIVRGVKSSGKVVYFTATFPYVVLLILLIRGATLPGSLDGVIFYIKPEFHKLLNAKVWKDAAVQIFYSLGPAWGGLHTLASYNKFDNNFVRDGIIIAFTNCGTSIFAGFAIFSVIGFMAHDSGLPIDTVADTGPGLAFVAYPEALARMPIAPLWSILFFFMLFTLGLDSQFVMTETLITAVTDELKYYFKNINKWKTLITFIVCCTFFLLGLPMTTRGGIYLLTLMDNYSAGFSLLLIALLECVVISLVYGINRFSKDMAVMVPGGLGLYWKVCLVALAPLVLAAIFVFFAVTYSNLTYSSYTYPPFAEALGWLMVLAAVVAIPIYASFFLIVRAKGDTLMERLRFSFKPSPEWGPASNSDRLKAGYPLLPGTSEDMSVKFESSPPTYTSIYPGPLEAGGVVLQAK
ncbi:sodium- and chloride-dependent glycine transporter 1-like [Patiria miniata]|uniref:Transporter n=1 Tax=Patiria miniata TaxID=46514 RepID=A0A914AAV3_PATMI|nr:sodium- and chloride-dependent glycine transporter 1-like [Patiria miniata]XP_038060571.1 sodium- and chloride-dependent glycine transporter 1-like [Patiria miniata]XP_038060572.1 sodium- and chloride-dependent glycine transporter 1-like [Patiria miniata]XP_038060573.1 sodium- and chloride-dependent glycine transporter 1-like [Patiria miniata]